MVRLLVSMGVWIALVAAGRPVPETAELSADTPASAPTFSEADFSRVPSYNNAFHLILDGTWSAVERDGWFVTFGDQLDFDTLPLMTFTFAPGGDLEGVMMQALNGDLGLPFAVEADHADVVRLDDPVVPKLFINQTAGDDHWLYLVRAGGGVLVVSWQWPVESGPDLEFKLSVSNFVANAFVNDEHVLQQLWRQSMLRR